MLVNFKSRGISQGACKLTRTLTLIIIIIIIINNNNKLRYILKNIFKHGENALMDGA